MKTKSFIRNNYMGTRKAALKNLKKVDRKNIRARGKAWKTIVKENAIEGYKQKVLARLPAVTEAQLGLAVGQDFLYKKVTTGKGKNKKRKWKLVTDPNEILDYLNEEFAENSGDEDYYQIATKKPDTRAIDSALDRTIGKAVNKVELGGEGGGPIRVDVDFQIALKKVYGKGK